MDPVALNTYLSTDRTFTKIVMGDGAGEQSTTGGLTEVPSGEIAIERYPSGIQGMLIEGAATNVFPDSQFLTTGVTATGGMEIFAGNGLMQLFAGGNHYTAALSATASGTIGTDFATALPWERVAISFLVRVGDGALIEPTIGGINDSTTNIAVQINGTDINPAAAEIEIVSGIQNEDTASRVRINIAAPSGGISSVYIGKNSAPERIEFGAIQIERDRWSSYIVTDGTEQTRAAENVAFPLTANQNFNPIQGTLMTQYSPTVYGEGSAVSIRKSDWSAYLALGHQVDSGGYPLIAAMESPLSSFGALVYEEIILPGVSYTGYETRQPDATIRASWSPYGARASLNGQKVGHMKDHESFRNVVFDEVQFGASFDGSHFYGHIKIFNLHARSFLDSELQTGAYVSPWILATGYWSDWGEWDDNGEWLDGDVA